jgi:hypothetical protein
MRPEDEKTLFQFEVNPLGLIVVVCAIILTGIMLCNKIIDSRDSLIQEIKSEVNCNR